MLLTTATVMSMTVGNVSFAAGTDMPTAVQQGGEESKKTEALNEQEETSQEVQESTERGGKEEDSKNESEEVAQEKNSAREDATEVQTQESKEEEGIAVQAAKTVYLNTVSGSDDKDGATSANAVKTLDKAVELAGEGGTGNLQTGKRSENREYSEYHNAQESCEKRKDRGYNRTGNGSGGDDSGSRSRSPKQKEEKRILR